jgi:diaminopimelate decarboxylase
VSNAQDRHEALERIVARDDCMLFAGKRVTDIAAEVGTTPFYAYDRRAIAERVASLRRVLPRGIELHYAVKANPLRELVAHVAPLVDGLDIASLGEMQLALDAGADPATMSFAGPGKSTRELEAAMRALVQVNLESPNEARRLAQAASASGARPRVAVRVNPDFELKASGMKMSGGPKQFGVDAEQVPDFLRELAKLPLDFTGFHIFAGSQNLSSEAIVEAQTKSLELAARLAEFAPAPVRQVNIGGGFGIPYFARDRSLDLSSMQAHFESLVRTAAQRLPASTLVLELGRYLVGEAGIYVCRVVDRKISRGHVFLVTDGGLHHHLAASGNFGQVIRKNYPVLVGNKVAGTVRELASVVGPLCTPLDLLADRMDLARADVGDLIVVLQSGAYGRSASPTAFLGHPPPKEVLL